MKHTAYIYSLLSVLLVSVCICACTFHEGLDTDECMHTEAEEGTYVHLDIKLFMGTRALATTPKPGEDGDGREEGIRHEDDIKNITVFFYRNVKGLDADGTTEFLYSRYFADYDKEWSTISSSLGITFKIKDYVPEDGDHVVVIANAGDLTSLNTLQQLRDYQTYHAWRSGSSISNDDLFVMSSAYNESDEGKLFVTPYLGTQSQPFRTSMYIQRTAARIDFMYNGSENYSSSNPNELYYDVKSTGGTTISTVFLQNIIPVNLMQQSSYLIKRVTTTNEITSSVRYGFRESGSAGVAPSTYVIEPHTLDKENKRVEELDIKLGTWYGSTRARDVFASPNSCLGDANSIATYMATKTEKSELGYFTHYMTLAYTNENTQSKEKHDPNFMTGLLLKATYVPTTVYSDASLTVVSYTKGTTFWRYTPTKASMVEEDCLYFENETAATAYKAAHPEDLAEIVEYVNGVCYYNLWLRHANVEADPHETFPMEYGIVRNNIYRVGVDKFTGPGTPTPSFEGPTRVHLRIFVRPWNRRVHPEILL